MSEPEVLQQVFAVQGQARLKAGNIRGSLRLTLSQTPEISVRAVKYLDDGDAANTRVSLEQEANGRVVVKVDHNGGDALAWLKFTQPCQVEIEISVPAEAQVEASTVQALLSASGLSGDLNFSTVSGEIELHALRGKLRISTVSGEVEAQELDGSLRLSTVSGDVCLEDSRLAELEATSVSGNLNLESSLAEGPYRLETISGDIDWLLPPETACQVQMTSVSGELSARLPAAQHFSGRGSKIGIGSGGPQLKINTVSGNCRLHSPISVETAV